MFACALLLAGMLSAQEPKPQQPQQQPSPQQPPTDDAARQAALEKALAELPEEPSAEPGAVPAQQQDLGSVGKLKLLDISFDAMFAVGSSTESDESLQTLEAGHHDPRKRGFTVQNVELALSGAVDPDFRANAYLTWGIDPLTNDTEVEMEEAYFTTTALPYGLELEGGFFFTEFGHNNPRHPHQWEWLDAPVINTRLFGQDGMRGGGARLGWLTPLPWFTEVNVGVQNANGDTMASFLASQTYYDDHGIAGREYMQRDVTSFDDMVWLGRIDTSWDFDDNTTVAIGASALYGPNATGPSGDTEIYGTDVVLRWTNGQGGRQAKELKWVTEFMYRRFAADPFTDESDPTSPVYVPGEVLGDWGFYTQAYYHFAEEWSGGLRFDWARSSGQDYDSTSQTLVSTNSDPFRDNRLRISPLLTWQATHFSRVRLQYNYDHADHLQSGDASSVWLGVEVAIGAHAAHKF